MDKFFNFSIHESRHNSKSTPTKGNKDDEATSSSCRASEVIPDEGDRIFVRQHPDIVANEEAGEAASSTTDQGFELIGAVGGATIEEDFEIIKCSKLSDDQPEVAKINETCELDAKKLHSDTEMQKVQEIRGTLESMNLSIFNLNVLNEQTLNEYKLKLEWSEHENRHLREENKKLKAQLLLAKQEKRRTRSAEIDLAHEQVMSLSDNISKQCAIFKQKLAAIREPQSSSAEVAEDEQKTALHHFYELTQTASSAMRNRFKDMKKKRVECELCEAIKKL